MDRKNALISQTRKQDAETRISTGNGMIGQEDIFMALRSKKSATQKYRTILTIVLLVSIITRFGSILYASRARFASSYWEHYEPLKDAYLHSQYIVSDPVGWIPDETLYSYAAGAYLKGESLLDVNPGTPPLGKYLFSLSIILSNNPNVILIFCFIGLFFGIYVLSKTIFRSAPVALILVLAMLFQPLITDQLKYMPLLDIPLIMFHVWSVYFFIEAVSANKPYCLVISIALIGLSMMTKIFSVSAPLLLIYTIYILMKKRKFLFSLVLGYVTIPVIAMAAYASIYFQGYYPWNILGIQKWSYLYNASKLNRFFTVWDLVFFNRWHVWWGNQEVIRDPNWHSSWPIIFGLCFFWLILQFRSFLNLGIGRQVLCIWIIVYFIMMSLNQASARYLLPILPFVYIAAADIVYDWYNWMIRKRRYGWRVP